MFFNMVFSNVLNMYFDMIFNVSFNMIFNVGIHMILNVRVYTTTNVAGDDEGALRNFRMSRFSWITWKFGMSMYPRIFQITSFFEYHVFQESSVPPNFSNVPFVPDNMEILNFRVPPNFSKDEFFSNFILFCVGAVHISEISGFQDEQ